MTRCANCRAGCTGAWINGRGQPLCGDCGPDQGTRATVRPAHAADATAPVRWPAWLPASEPGLRAIWCKYKHTAERERRRCAA